MCGLLLMRDAQPAVGTVCHPAPPPQISVCTMAQSTIPAHRAAPVGPLREPVLPLAI